MDNVIDYLVHTFSLHNLRMGSALTHTHTHTRTFSVSELTHK